MNRFLIILLFGIPIAGLAGNADDVLGTWSTKNDKSKIEITRCENFYCGEIVWLKEPNYADNDSQGMAGQSKVDRNNPDESLKKRPLIGLMLLQGFSYNGENEWKNGTIYDPENGKTYKCKLTLDEHNKLEVRGFIGISLFGRTSVWSRAE